MKTKTLQMKDGKTISLTEVNSLKEVASRLNISYYKARKIKNQIKSEFPDTPSRMIFNGKYVLESFKRYL